MGICDALYNKETGAILTRTPASWGKIGLFYFIYYSCLAAFFAGLLAIFLYSFTDEKAPLLTGSHSVLPQNPGMGFRPRPKEDKTMIKYSVGKKDYDDYVNDMDAFLNSNITANTYFKGQSDQHYQTCTESEPLQNATWMTPPCKFYVPDMTNVMANCVDSGTYGFEDGTPCFVVKLNKIYEFVPKLKSTTDKEFLEIECEGEHPADKDNIGELEYFPKKGVDLHFFPYVGQQGYLSPLVFVKMMKPARGVLIQIVCKPVNAENIEQKKMMRGDGRVTLEVLIDN